VNLVNAMKRKKKRERGRGQKEHVTPIVASVRGVARDPSRSKKLSCYHLTAEKFKD